MEMILATKSGTPIIGQIAVVMGWIMNGIYKILDMVGINNLGLCIIIFSILIYLFMTPLQIKQQKFSKLSAIMQPEIQKIQKKYQGKKDQESMMKMQEETQPYIRNTEFLLQEAVFSLQFRCRFFLLCIR